jgi:hypothetical protein
MWLAIGQRRHWQDRTSAGGKERQDMMWWPRQTTAAERNKGVQKKSMRILMVFYGGRSRFASYMSFGVLKLSALWNRWVWRFAPVSWRTSDWQFEHISNIKYMYFSLFTWQQINTPVGIVWSQGFLAGYILMRWKSVCQTPGPSKTTTSKHKMGSILSPSRFCAFRMTPCNQQSQGPYLYLFAASPGFPSSWLSDVSDCRPSAPLHRIRIWIHTWVPTDLHISGYS